ncbi:aldehyde dehydrogenase family protein [Brenneria rubrifaciens]|nr:aldehyde dehydrogenase family protein [Brenneria rubrifaciens]
MKWCKNISADIIGKSQENVINIQAGFGPTGLPHIGTLCEVLRTDIINKYFTDLGYKVNFFLISDDLDPFRKVPSNIPEADTFTPFLGKPICMVPDPFHEFNSFSNMAEDRLMKLVKDYGIECQLIRSSDAYRSGFYNKTIKFFLEKYDEINELCRMSTGALRQRTYSMIMPLSKITGNVLEHIKITEIDHKRGEITYFIPSDEVVNKPGFEYGVSLAEFYKDEVLDREMKISALNGECKLQWKADWAMRQLVRNIDFEMHGEDLRASASVVRKIAETLNYKPPILYSYGLFLDVKGKKISKSKGNGFSLEEAQLLLSHAAINKFLSTDPKRSRRFYPAMSPRLNDIADHNNQNIISHHKLSRILTAFNPLSKTAARTFLESKVPLLLNDKDKVERCIELFFRVNINNKPVFGLTEDEVYIFYRLAQRIEALHNQPRCEICDSILETLSENLPGKSRHERYQLLYRGLLGTDSGPRLKTWITMHSHKEIVFRLNNPYRAEHANPEKNFFPSLRSNAVIKGEKRMRKPALTTEIRMDEVQNHCNILVSSLRERKESIVKSLSGYQCKNVTLDEISRSCDFLENISANKEYFVKRINGVTSFLPLNQPIYASVCFGFIPSLMADDVCIRPPTAMHEHYRYLMNALDLPSFSSALQISFEDKDIFLSKRVNVTDAVIFTGTPENARKVRKHFRRDALFILNGAGHNPLIISDDADLNNALDSTLRVVLYNQGQDCAGPNAILVHHDIHKQFTDMLIAALKARQHQVGHYRENNVIVGPNSDIDHCIKMAYEFRTHRQYCIYGGETNPVTGMIKPTVFSKPLMEGGNYREFFAPVFFIQKYDHDDELETYFSHSQYSGNAMYISLFGSSRFIDNGLSGTLHRPESILRNTDLHIEERGFLPYGGQGTAASCLWINGQRINGSTLPQRDIFNYLVKPVLEAQ